MLYNLVAKEFMIARYLKLSKIIPAVTAGRSILPGSAQGRELPLAASELLLAARVLAAAAPRRSCLRSWDLGDPGEGCLGAGGYLFILFCNCRAGGGGPGGVLESCAGSSSAMEPRRRVGFGAGGMEPARLPLSSVGPGKKITAEVFWPAAFAPRLKSLASLQSLSSLAVEGLRVRQGDLSRAR